MNYSYAKLDAISRQTNKEFINARYVILSASVKPLESEPGNKIKNINKNFTDTMLSIGAVNILLRDLKGTPKELREIADYCHNQKKGADILTDVNISDKKWKESIERFASCGFDGLEIDMKGYDGTLEKDFISALSKFRKESVFTLKLPEGMNREIFENLKKAGLNIKFIKEQSISYEGIAKAADDECLVLRKKVNAISAGMVEVSVENLSKGIDVLHLGVKSYRSCLREFKRLTSIIQDSPSHVYEEVYKYGKEDVPEISFWEKIKEIIDDKNSTDYPEYANIRNYLAGIDKDAQNVTSREIESVIKAAQAEFPKPSASFTGFNKLNPGEAINPDQVSLFAAFFKALIEITLAKNDLIKNKEYKWRFKDAEEWKRYCQLLLIREFNAVASEAGIEPGKDVNEIIEKLNNMKNILPAPKFFEMRNNSLKLLNAMLDRGAPGAMTGLIEVLRLADSEEKIKVNKEKPSSVTNAVSDLLGAA